MTVSRKQPLRTLPFEDEVAFTVSDARHVNLFGEIGLGAMGHVANVLDYMILKNPRKPITVLLNSHGGSVIDGLAIYDLIKQANKKTPVNVTVAGACMSMATIILQAGRERAAHKNSQFLLHEISYGMAGQHSAHKDYQEQAQRLQDRLNKILSDRSGMSIETLEKLTARRDYTISAQEALEHGLIDKIIE